MNLRYAVFGILTLSFMPHSASAETANSQQLAAVSTADHSEQIALMESSLRPTYGVQGGDDITWSLAERMKHYDVPGVSIAVAIDGKLAWAKAYGIADKNSARKIDTDTLFQAASLSKPVASLAALALVQDGLLSLDRPANQFLKRWHIPSNDFTRQQPVTIRHLVSHRAGTTVHGFRGYQMGDTIPTLPQILDGIAPAHSKPVIVNQLPGKQYRYSGGGYTILQLAIEDATGQTYADVVKDRIFIPAGMPRSNFRYPVNDPNAAVGHTGSSASSMAGKPLSYPELAAAGLWTTPTELVKLGSLVARARNSGNALLKPSLIRQLVPDSADEPGLGFGLNDPGDGVAFVHHGHNPGYSARWINYADGRASVAILTNSDSGGDLIREILSGLGHIYGWKQDAFEAREVTPLSKKEMQAIAGTYTFETPDGPPVATISIVADQLWIEGELTDRARFYPANGTKFFIAKGLNFEAEKSAEGQVEALSVEGEIRLVRAPAK